MHRFFIDPTKIAGKVAAIDDEKMLHQMMHVLRMKVGEEMMVMDNLGHQYLAKISELGKRRAQLELLGEVAVKPGVESAKNIFVYQAIPKNLAKFELVLQKCTELGAKGFFPLITKRTEMHNLRNVPRLEMIIKEAAEQCGAVSLPVLGKAVKVDQLLKDAPADLNLLAYEKEDSSTLKSLKPSIDKADVVNIFIGPEGGWTEEEVEALSKIGFVRVGLGARILRTETAALAMVSAICLT